MTVVAIDGPAGAGKSTIARRVAERLGFDYLDTGALYRAVTLAVVAAGEDPHDRRAAEGAAAGAEIGWNDGEVTLEGRDVGGRIRETDITAAVSAVAAHPGVRRALLERQRRVARRGHVVIEGRDIGTVVVPDATVKVFLTASPAERAVRRARQLGIPDDDAEIDRLEAAMAARDRADATRTESPFARAADAIVLDSTDRRPDEVVDEIVRIVTERIGG